MKAQGRAAKLFLVLVVGSLVVRDLRLSAIADGCSIVRSVGGRQPGSGSSLEQRHAADAPGKAMRYGQRVLLAGAAALSLAVVQLPRPAEARAAAMPSDFDGDGYADLAIGVPYEDAGSKSDVGVVNVLYGTATGLRAAGDQRWDQDTPGVKGKSRYSERFGYALASGDFDRDGRADLAIGVQRDEVDGERAGAVNVLYGSRAGLTAAGDQRWSQRNLPGVPERSDHFGESLTAADFNGDGFWDLAMAAPGDDVVQVVYGSPDGLRAAGTTTLPGGWLLAAGDVNGDGYADLAAGGGGRVRVAHGSAGGLGGGWHELWAGDALGLNESQPTFGADVEMGDFDGDGFADLAAGAQHARLTACPGHARCSHGAVAVIYGSSTGLTAVGSQVWHEDSPGIPGTAGDEESFGRVLAAGDFNGDGSDDLAVGAPGDNETGEEDGAVLAMYGGPAGLSATGARLWTRESPGIPRPRGAPFGWSLASANYGRSARDDLAIGAPERTHVLYGRATGLSTTNAQTWSQDSPGIAGSTESGDRFGGSLSP